MGANLNTNDPNDPNKGQVGSQAPTIPYTPGQASGTSNLQAASSSPTGSGAKGSAAPTVTAPSAVTRQGTGFTNIQRIAKASEGNQLGSGLAGNIQEQVGQVGSGIQQAKEQTTQQQQSSFPALTDITDKVTSVLSNPSGASQADIDAVKQYMSGQYTGPKELIGATGLQSKVAQAQALGQLAGTHGGQQALLQNFMGGQPGYTSGHQMLDLALLSRSPQAALNAARQQTSGLGQKLETAEQSARQKAEESQKLAETTGQTVTGQVQGAETAAEKDLADRVAAANASKSTEFSKMFENLSKNPPSKEQLISMGISPQYFEGVKDLSSVAPVTSYLSQNPSLDAGNIATSADVAKFDALAKLTGKPSYAKTQGLTGTPSQQKSYSFNIPGYNEALKREAAREQYNEQVAKEKYAAQLEAEQKAGRERAEAEKEAEAERLRNLYAAG